MWYPREEWLVRPKSDLNELPKRHSVATWLILAPVLVLLCRCLYLQFWSPLSKVPGPSIARFSRWWLAYHGRRGDFHQLLTRMHEQYGEVVRIGPDEVITISPEAVKKIYGMMSATVVRSRVQT